MPTLSLDAIQQRVAQQEKELQTLRRELATRQSRLQALAQRKQSLQERLRHIDAEMAAIAAGTKRPGSGSTKPAHQAAAKQPASKSSSPTLTDLIVAIVQDAGRSLTVQQITQAVKHRGFPSKSKALHKLVGKTVYLAATKGRLRRTGTVPAAFSVPSGTGSVVGGRAAKPTKTATTASSAASPKRATRGGTKAAPGSRAGSDLPLKPLLEQILQKSTKPMTGNELAQAALQAGYRTTSKRFVNSVWTALTTMKNVENVKGQGYRLKRGKS
jgi:hypothetical protein